MSESIESAPDAREPTPRRHPFHSVRRLALKELREILRDRRTILTLLLMPLLVYPLVSLLFQRFLLLSDLPKTAQWQYLLAVESPSDDSVDAAGSRFLELLEHGSRLRSHELKPAAATPHQDSPSATGEFSGHQLRAATSVTDLLLDHEIDLGIRVRFQSERRVRPSAPGPDAAPLDIELVYLAESAAGKAAAAYVEERIAAVEKWQLVNRLRELKQRPPAQNSVHRVATGDDERPQVSHFTLLPLILILMTITGAVYPAIDLTAGERERGTLEMLVAAPISRVALLLGKYCAVLTVAVLTATVNLIAMALTLASTGLGQALFGDAGITFGTVAQIFCLMILFAAFFSAVLLVLTSFARSFKEAQAYLIPLMLLALAPGIFSLMPSVELAGVLVVTPLVNIVLLARDMFDGSPSLWTAGAVITSTAIYALAAIAVAARIFGTDAILYGSQSSWGDLLRRPERVTAVPSLTSALLSLAILFPLFFLAKGLGTQLADLSLSGKLLLNALLTFALFVGIPILVGLMARLDWRSGFCFRRPTLPALGVCVVLGLCMWPLAYELILLADRLDAFKLDAAQLEQVKQLAAKFRAVPLPLLLFSIAVMPAVCEEFFFRGFLMNAMRPRMSNFLAILGSATLFGLFHVVESGGLAVTRFLPSTFMGLVLGWVCCRTGSVFPGMLLHLLHNGFLMVVTYHPDVIAPLGLSDQEQRHLPVMWILVPVVLVVTSLLTMAMMTRRAEAGSPQSV